MLPSAAGAAADAATLDPAAEARGSESPVPEALSDEVLVQRCEMVSPVNALLFSASTVSLQSLFSACSVFLQCLFNASLSFP